MLSSLSLVASGNGCMRNLSIYHRFVICITRTLTANELRHHHSIGPISSGRLTGHHLKASLALQESLSILPGLNNKRYLNKYLITGSNHLFRAQQLYTLSSQRFRKHSHVLSNQLLITVSSTQDNYSITFSTSVKKYFSNMTIDSKIKKLIQKELVVFDFDDTLVDCNSDTWVHQLAPNKTIPNELMYQAGQDYFKHVQSVLNYLHSVKVTKLDYVSSLSKMPQVSGMIDTLVKGLGKHNDKYDMIILSDANSFFISTFLESQSISDLFSTILTNQGKFNDSGQLILNEYHIQDYCPISARNLCKGEALKNYIGKRMLDHNVVYTCINYVGDGENDLCPSTKLGINDRIFPRKGFALDRLCSRLKMELTDSGPSDGQYETLKKVVANLKASVIPWVSGKDILETIINPCKSTTTSKTPMAPMTRTTT